MTSKIGLDVGRLEVEAHLTKYKYAVYEWEKLNGHLNTCSICRSGLHPRCEDYLTLETSVRGLMRSADLNVGWTTENVPCWCGHPRDIHLPQLDNVCCVATCECLGFSPAVSHTCEGHQRASAGRGDTNQT